MSSYFENRKKIFKPNLWWKTKTLSGLMEDGNKKKTDTNQKVQQTTQTTNSIQMSLSADINSIVKKKN